MKADQTGVRATNLENGNVRLPRYNFMKSGTDFDKWLDSV
jgi:hypothetical protein